MHTDARAEEAGHTQECVDCPILTLPMVLLTTWYIYSSTTKHIYAKQNITSFSFVSRYLPHQISNSWTYLGFVHLCRMAFRLDLLTLLTKTTVLCASYWGECVLDHFTCRHFAPCVTSSFETNYFGKISQQSGLRLFLLKMATLVFSRIIHAATYGRKI